MKSEVQHRNVRFMRRGQVVIPQWLRREFAIEEGTRAVVTATPEGILIRPITGALIERGFGLLKRPAGDPPLADEWAGHKREERAQEEAKYARHGA
jgi:AbrB family looped-hinge helix DNA binding protein